MTKVDLNIILECRKTAEEVSPETLMKKFHNFTSNYIIWFKSQLILFVTYKDISQESETDYCCGKG